MSTCKCEDNRWGYLYILVYYFYSIHKELENDLLTINKVIYYNLHAGQVSSGSLLVLVLFLQMPLANQSHGNITDYEVTWTKTTETNQENRCTVPNTKHECEISLNTTEEHLVTVTARNNNGSSPPSNITVPRYDPGMKLIEM